MNTSVGKFIDVANGSHNGVIHCPTVGSYKRFSNLKKKRVPIKNVPLELQNPLQLTDINEFGVWIQNSTVEIDRDVQVSIGIFNCSAEWCATHLFYHSATYIEECQWAAILIHLDFEK